MKKKILAVMLSAALTITMLVGCGDDYQYHRYGNQYHTIHKKDK